MGRKIISLAFVCMGFFGLGYFGRYYVDNHFKEQKQKDSELIGELRLKTDSVPFTPVGYFTAIDNEGRRYKINYDAINKEVAIKEVKLENKIAKSD